MDEPSSSHPGFLDPPTDEAAWRAWGEALPEHRPTPARVLVVAPHPDDETLAVGASLADWAAVGVPVTVVTVTDGEGSHPGHPGLVEVRAAEQAAALAELGLGPAQRLGMPDGRVADHHHELVDALAARCGPDTLVLAPWELDAHTDHDAAGRAAAEAAARVGAERWSFPVWSYQWATPGHLAALAPGRLVPSATGRAAKARAVACYRSQLDELAGITILPAEVVAHFTRPWELVLAPLS